MAYWFPIFGSIFLIFRIWLCEVKLVKPLDYRRHYVSRFLTYFYAIAMILSFENAFMNISVAGSLPAMVIIFLTFDFRYIRDHTGKRVEEEIPLRFWLLVERWTLHPPLIITGIYWYVIGLKTIVLYPVPSIGYTLLAIALPIVTFLTIDPRWTKKTEAPLGYIMLLIAILSGAGLCAYLYL
jgi:hypothetical protein